MTAIVAGVVVVAAIAALAWRFADVRTTDCPPVDGCRCRLDRLAATANHADRAIPGGEL